MSPPCTTHSRRAQLVRHPRGPAVCALQNHDRAYHGPLSLREALATSSNISAVRVLDHIGVPALLDMAERLGIESLSQDSGRYGLALTLGGGEVTPLELTAAYAAFANGGQRVTPFAIVSIARCAGPPTEPRTRTNEPTAWRRSVGCRFVGSSVRQTLGSPT